LNVSLTASCSLNYSKAQCVKEIAQTDDVLKRIGLSDMNLAGELERNEDKLSLFFGKCLIKKKFEAKSKHLLRKQ